MLEVNHDSVQWAWRGEDHAMTWCDSGTGKGSAQTPTVPYDELHVTIHLRQPNKAHGA
jgi:hypothetical protein